MVAIFFDGDKQRAKMKNFGLYFILSSAAVIFCEALTFLSFGAMVQFGMIIFQLGASIFGWQIFKQFDWRNFFYVDAELRKKNKIVKELWNEILIMAAGIFLIMPGLFTDMLGGVLLIDTVREWLCENVFYKILI